MSTTELDNVWGVLGMANFTKCHRMYARLLIYIDKRSFTKRLYVVHQMQTSRIAAVVTPVSLRPRTVLGEADPRTTASRYGVLWLKKSPDITWLPHSDSDYKYSIKIESKQRHIKISPWVGEPQNYPSYFYGVTARLSATSAKIFSCTGKKVANGKFNIWVSGACKRKHKRWNHASCYYYQRK